MPISRTPIVDDDGTGTTGTVLDNSWKQQFYNQIDAAIAPLDAAAAVWTDIPYSAANFGATGGGGAWSVDAADQTRFAYLRLGKTAFIQIYIVSSTVTGTPTSVNLVLPFTVLAGQSGLGYFLGASGQYGWCLYDQPSSDQFLRFKRDTFGGTYSAVTNAFYLYASLTVQTL